MTDISCLEIRSRTSIFSGGEHSCAAGDPLGAGFAGTGSVDEATYNALFGEIESLRGRVGERVDKLRLLEAELRNSSSVTRVPAPLTKHRRRSLPDWKR